VERRERGEQRGPARVALLSQAQEHREEALAAAGEDAAEMAAQPGDLQVHEGLGHARPAARAGRAEPAQQGLALARRGVL
jgi:hypothetical protein